ncbi:hypothetical protein GE061_003359 [Apolygus lucorum]|uniref:Uncharacterized protein n=1 Tax=Apolygus lucorum TaxID=248454 RepID=A0A6A4JMN5_APOLU|nr:hypothetical protein GE061_003359 [Apolygus lucorum]
MFRSALPSAERAFQCARCSKRYKRKGSLMYHTRNECGQPPKYFCDFCPYMTTIKSNFTRHCTMQHFSERSSRRCRV